MNSNKFESLWHDSCTRFCIHYSRINTTLTAVQKYFARVLFGAAFFRAKAAKAMLKAERMTDFRFACISLLECSL